MKTFYIILLLLFGVNTYAQEFYLTAFEGIFQKNQIIFVDSDLNQTQLASMYVDGFQLLDIAFAPDGKLYGVYADAIIEIDIANNSYTVVYVFPVSGIYNSLVCNADNQIVALEYYTNHLVTIDLNTFTEVSDVVLSASSPGDLTYYKGNLIFQSSSTYDILGYDGNILQTVACKPLYYDGDTVIFLGFSNYTDSCNNNFVYGFDSIGFVYRYDIEANTSEAVGIFEHTGNPINGSTTINEYAASACPLLNLEEVNCNLNTQDQQLSNLLLYPNPVTDMLHIQGLNTQEELFFSIYSMEGRKLAEDLLTPEIDFSKLSPGVYLMEIYNKSKTVSTTKRIVKN